MWKSLLKLLRGQSGGRLLGTALGILCGFLYLIVGFWDMLIFAFIVFVGYWIGSGIDRGQPLFDWRPVVNWLMQRWKD